MDAVACSSRPFCPHHGWPCSRENGLPFAARLLVDWCHTAVTSAVCVALCGSLGMAGCTDLGEFQTSEGEAFVGDVIGTVEDEETCSPSESSCSFIRRGFPVGTVLSLTFEPSLAESEPGTLTTSDETLRCLAGAVDAGSLCVDSNGDGDANTCPAAAGRTFDGTPMVPILPLENDQLSLYDFPGVGRLKSYIFTARPEAGPFVGRDLMVFLSLMRDGGAEVRIVSGAGDDCRPDTCREMSECQLFGVFRLRKRRLP